MDSLQGRRRHLMEPAQTADTARANPHPGPSVFHDFDCTHNPCRCPAREDADYVVFPRATFFEFLGAWALPPWPDVDGHLTLGGDVDCAPLAERLAEWVKQNDLSSVVFPRLIDGRSCDAD